MGTGVADGVGVGLEFGVTVGDGEGTSPPTATPLTLPARILNEADTPSVTLPAPSPIRFEMSGVIRRKLQVRVTVTV